MNEEIEKIRADIAARLAKAKDGTDVHAILSALERIFAAHKPDPDPEPAQTESNDNGA